MPVWLCARHLLDGRQSSMTPVRIIIIMENFSFPIQGETDERDKLPLAFFPSHRSRTVQGLKKPGAFFEGPIPIAGHNCEYCGVRSFGHTVNLSLCLRAFIEPALYAGHRERALGLGFFFYVQPLPVTALSPNSHVSRSLCFTIFSGLNSFHRFTVCSSSQQPEKA